MPLRRRNRIGRLVAAGVVTTTAISAAGVAAETSPRMSVAVVYRVDRGVHGCPEEAEFRGSVAKQLGYDPFRSEAVHNIVAEVIESEPGLEGHIEWTDAHGNEEGERRLASPDRDCVELAKGMTFAIAVQIQVLNASESAPPPAAEAKTLVPAPVVVTPTPAILRAAKLDIAIGVGPMVDFGGAPSLSGGARLFTVLRAHVLSLELGAEGTLPVTLRQPDGTGFSASTLGATIAPCGHRGRFAVCAMGVLGVLRAHGFGVDKPHSPLAFTGSAGLRITLDQRLFARWLTVVHVDGLLNWARGTVSLNDVPLWTTPNVALVLGIDLAVLLR
jgi:hypothetical protein